MCFSKTKNLLNDSKIALFKECKNPLRRLEISGA